MSEEKISVPNLYNIEDVISEDNDDAKFRALLETLYKRVDTILGNILKPISNVGLKTE